MKKYLKEIYLENKYKENSYDLKNCMKLLNLNNNNNNNDSEEKFNISKLNKIKFYIK
jgi:hypothetical protein